MHMENNSKYKVLVLSDLTDASVNVLKSAARIAEIIKGEIEIFHVRKPTKVVENESHLSAVRAIKDHYVLVDKKLKTVVASISESTRVKVNHFFAFGNIKNEIEAHIKKTQPDIVVLGKKMSNTPNFLGDNIFAFILKKFRGVVMVANNENVLESQTKLSLGLFNSTNLESDIPTINKIISNAEGPIRSFAVANTNEEPTAKGGTRKDSIVSYIFEKNDQTLNAMSNYMDRNKVNLLLVDRKSIFSSSSENVSISELSELTATINIPLLLSNN
jgi:nucleotide-binding universal stress UspA family protein